MAEQQSRKLNSWKEIADFLGRDVRTVRRWETERGLPVYRGPEGKGSSVYADTRELEAWLKASSQLEESSPRGEPGPPANLIPSAVEAQSGLQNTASTSARSKTGRGMLLTLLVAVVALTGFLVRQLYLPVSQPQAGRIMLAVLPFSNLSGDANQEYFSDGLTEEMIAEISRLNPRRLGVIARTSSMAYKHTTERIDQIGRELGVDYILECSVRRADKQARITVQLIRASDQTHVWAQNYDRQIKDILTLESEVAQTVARQVGVELRAQLQPAPPATSPTTPEAYEAYLQGRFYWSKRNTPSLKKSVEYFWQAIALDPNYSLAWTGLADSYVLLGFSDVSPSEVMPEAKAAAMKAVELDQTLADAHISLAGVKTVYDWDWPGAEKEFKRALELNPGDAQAHHWYAILYCTALGRTQEAIAEMEQAQKLDPVSAVIRTDLGWAYFTAGQSDRAIELYKRALELDPHFVETSDRLSQAYVEKGMYEQAIDLLVPGEPPEVTSAMKRGLREAGYRGALEAEVRVLTRDQTRQQFLPAYSLALIYAELGDNNQAMTWLEKAYQQHYPALIYLKADPIFTNLHGDQRFQAMLRRIGLAS